MAPVSVAVVGEDALARGGLFAQLRSEPSISVAGEGDLEQLELLVQDRRPEALIWDLGVDPRAALASAPRVVQVGVPCAVLLDDEDLTSRALGAGLAGAVRRDAPPAQIAAAAVAVSRGLGVWPVEWSAALARSGPAASVEALTERESQVLALLAEGLSNKQIAVRLDVSEHTAKFHVNAIMSKLGAQSRTEAVVRAARLGWLML